MLSFDDAVLLRALAACEGDHTYISPSDDLEATCEVLGAVAHTIPEFGAVASAPMYVQIKWIALQLRYALALVLRTVAAHPLLPGPGVAYKRIQMQERLRVIDGGDPNRDEDDE